MKAVVLTGFGAPDVLQIQEVAKPVPQDHEILIRVHATTVSASDSDVRRLKFPLLVRLLVRFYIGMIRPKPMILGQEVAGEVEAVGAAVTRYQPGDGVFGWTGLRLGGYAEYLCLPETAVLTHKPANVSYEEVVPLVVGGLDALDLIRKAQIRPGQRVVVVGAGGSIGTFAVQLAKYWGAEVTAVDRAGKLDMLRTIGADYVLDYTREDFTRRGVTYDVIFDVMGTTRFSRSLRSLTPQGYYLIANARLPQQLLKRLTAKRRTQQIYTWTPRTAAEYAVDFAFLKDRIVAGEIKAVVDRCYPFEQAAEAHRYVDTGRKKGNVVITLAPAGPA